MGNTKRFNFSINVAGCATCGKDSLFNTLQKILSRHNIELQRYALADELKLEINDFCKQNYGISAFTKNSKEKEVVRHLMIAHGKAKRILTNGTYWTDLISNNISSCLDSGIIPCITDIRYCQYENDELTWLRNRFNGVLIYIEKILSNGQILQPTIPDEIENCPKLKMNSDFILRWPETLDERVWMDCVNSQLKPLLDKIVNK